MLPGAAVGAVLGVPLFVGALLAARFLREGRTALGLLFLLVALAPLAYVCWDALGARRRSRGERTAGPACVVAAVLLAAATVALVVAVLT
ncbi:hypothetical protein B1813_20405 [Saccharomonospora piscinae]|uniref:Uncharacterized protein n=1 Tax=Saccharomonospora piscinae TaxID=687388 RepID=A0A1V8ZXA5_SACPI|nr:hypothetical protein B1813_20405 [Saccharomonospora piscinae]